MRGTPHKITILCSVEQHNQYIDQAKYSGISMSQWIRDALAEKMGVDKFCGYCRHVHQTDAFCTKYQQVLEGEAINWEKCRECLEEG